MNLVEYGIWSEKSHYRVHVSASEKVAFIFETEEARELIRNGRYRKTSAFINQQKSAEGVLLPVTHLTSCSSIDIGIMDWIHSGFFKAKTTKQKGDAAEELVADLFEKGKFGFGQEVTRYYWEDKVEQLQGVDMTVWEGEWGWNIEVKFDKSCGTEQKKGSTGNFFIQTAERRIRN
jgi:hypothetical protein